MKTGKVVTSCVIVTWSWVCNNTKSVEITRLPPFRKLEFQYGICIQSWILSVLRCFFYLFLLNELNKSQIQLTTKWCTVWILELKAKVVYMLCLPSMTSFLLGVFGKVVLRAQMLQKLRETLIFLCPEWHL